MEKPRIKFHRNSVVVKNYRQMTTNKSTKYERNYKHIYLIQMIYMYECMY